MRIAFLLLFTLHFLHASGEFWPDLIDTEKRFYARTTASDANRSGDAEDALLDAKFDAFKNLVSLLKIRPYDVQHRKNPFFNPDSAETDRFRLEARLRVNTDHGNALAVARDSIALDDLNLRKQIYSFFVHLSDQWTKLDSLALSKLLARERNTLRAIPLKQYEAQWLKTPPPEGGIGDALSANLQQLRSDYTFYDDFLTFLELNPQLLHYRSLLQYLQLGTLIDGINQTATARELNPMLRFVRLDLGRFLPALGTILLAMLIAFTLYYRIYRLIHRLIVRKADPLDELMLSNLQGLRKPVFILATVFGIDLAVTILHYPQELPNNGIFFYLIYLLIITYIVMILLDNIVYHLLLKRAEHSNKEMRRELLNLILSIIKIAVLIVALILFLIRAGVNITGLLASLGIGGLAVALAAKDTLSNFFGLLKILSDNSFSQGDWIQSGDIEGTVIEIGFISTDIRTFDNALITVPNERLAGSALKNYSRRTVGRRIKMHIGVTYGSDREKLAHAIDAIRTMLYEHPDTIVEDQFDKNHYSDLYKREKKLVSVEDKYGIKTTLMVYLDQLSSSSMDILIYAFTNTIVWAEWLAIKQDIIFKIWEILDEHDLEFAFPSQSLYFDKTNIDESLEALRPTKPDEA